MNKHRAHLFFFSLLGRKEKKVETQCENEFIRDRVRETRQEKIQKKRVDASLCGVFNKNGLLKCLVFRLIYHRGIFF